MNEILQRPAAASSAAEPSLAWRNNFAALGPAFFTELQPTPLPSPALVGLNQTLAEDLGLDASWLASPDGVEVLTGNRLLTGARPLASVYSGHQFGVWAGQLGDGRAVLRSSIREYLGSEAMQGLGIPTTRALAVTGSPQAVRREEVETAAVV